MKQDTTKQVKPDEVEVVDLISDEEVARRKIRNIRMTKNVHDEKEETNEK